MLSSIATLAYDFRRPEFFTDQLYAALTLVDRGAVSDYGALNLARMFSGLHPISETR
jgi:membrane-bound lytic murein transglycosylase B